MTVRAMEMATGPCGGALEEEVARDDRANGVVVVVAAVEIGTETGTGQIEKEIERTGAILAIIINIIESLLHVARSLDENEVEHLPLMKGM